MLIATSTLITSCAKQDVLPEEAPAIVETPDTRVPFALFASAADTKTSTEDGVTVNWSTSDSLNVFHALAGGSEYGTNDKFIITAEDLASNRFTGTITSALDQSESYDWYVLYPYVRQISTPANTSAGYMSIGAYNKSTSQTQTGNSSKAHLAGRYFPLYGKAENVDATASPSITMSQALSVVKIHVKNANETPLTVSNVSFVAPEDVVGQYFIDFTGETPVFTKRSEATVSDTASLAVAGGAPLAKDEYADFYIAVKPFTAAPAAKLGVLVNGVKKTVTIGGSAVSFVPGKIKTINYTYNYVSAISEPTQAGWYRVEDASWLAAGDRVFIVNAAGDQAMSTEQKTNNRGAVSVTAAEVGVYKTIASPGASVQTFVLENGTASGSFAFRRENGSAGNYIYAASSSANQLKSQDSVDANASFIANLTDGVGALTAQGSNSRKVLQYNYNNGTPIFSCYGSANQTGISIYKYYSGPATPVINVTSANPMAVANTAGSGTITYNITNPTAASLTAALKVQEPAVTWITNINYGTAGSVTFDIAAQETDAAERSAVIVLSYEGAENVEVTVNQAAGPASGGGSADPVTINVYSNLATVTGSDATQTATWTSGDITVSAVRNDSGTAFRSSDTDHTRFYTGWTLTVSSASKTISSVAFTCMSTSYASTLGGCSFTQGSPGVSGSVVTVSSVSATSTATTLSAQVRISSITVNYAGDTPTPPALATATASVTTSAATSVTSSSAVLNGSFSGASGNIYETGFYWGTSQDNLGSQVTTDGSNAASGNFSCTLGDQAPLSAGTTYYYKAYVLEWDESTSAWEERLSETVLSFTTSAAEPTGAAAYLYDYGMPDVSGLNPTQSQSGTNGARDDSWYRFSTNSAQRQIAVHTYPHPSTSDETVTYVVLYDESKYAPLWTAHTMNTNYWPNNSVGRNENWSNDPAISLTQQTGLDNANTVGYSRGHLVASEYRQTTVNQNKQTFYYSNQAPQWQTGFNGSSSSGEGVWQTLENRVSTMAPSGSSTMLYVVTGVLYEGNTTTLHSGSLQVPIPSHFYKCIMKCSFTGSTITAAQGIAFVYTNQTHTGENYYDGAYVTSIDAIEARAGFDFFAAVPSAVQASAEANTNGYWFTGIQPQNNIAPVTDNNWEAL